MELRTNRLKIRSFRETDLEDTFEIYSNKNICRFLLHEQWTSSSKDKEFHNKLMADQLSKEASVSQLCERVGMRKEAHFIKDFWSKGEWTDTFTYGMLISDFKNSGKGVANLNE